MTRSYQEVLVSSIGDFGRVQGLIVLACKAPEFIGAWSMIMMSFAGAEPDWWKITHKFNKTSKVTVTFLCFPFFASIFLFFEHLVDFILIFI